MEREGAGTGAEDGSGAVRKGSEVDGRSLTFPSPPPQESSLCQVGVGERSTGLEGEGAQAPGEHTGALSPSATIVLQRDSVTPRLIHMQKACMKAPNEEGINYCLISLLFL